MITGINESKMLAKYISCEYNVNLNGKKCNSNQQQNNDKYQYECKTQKNIVSEKKVIFGILLHVVLKMVNMQEGKW